ncbi:hypothetical protein BsWGS_25771 [Bradybaena similaris]
MAETGIHCDLCGSFFHKEKEYVTHCEGKKHKAKELLAVEHDRANRRLFVRGIDWMQDPRPFLHSYFNNFGRLNGIVLKGRPGSMSAIVEFQDQDAISRALRTKHHIGRHAMIVKAYKYQPQSWERHKLANEELQEEEKLKHAQTQDQVSQVLLAADSLRDQINLVAENLKLDFAERRARVAICEELTALFLPHFENCRVYQFGSSVNGFGAKGCDLDLFLDIDDDKASSDKNKVKKLSQILSSSRGYTKVLMIPSSRCPVVRFLHQSSKIKCDLSINNRKALHNSYLLRLYSTDHRVHKLVSIVRLWARSQGLTSAMGGAHLFTSYAITLIVLYFLMHRKPRLIPLVCDIEKCVAGTCREGGENSETLCIPCNAELPPSDNKDNEVDLVKEFFAFCSESINWDTDALLMKDATVFPRSKISQDPSFIGCKAGCMTVIDPFVLTHNVVANVNEWTKEKFITELKRAADLTRDWPASVDKLESKPWGIAELLVPSLDQTARRKRKKPQPAATSNNGQGKGQDVGVNVKVALQRNVTRVEGEQESGEFCITVQPVSQSLTCAQLLLTAKQNNVTPAEQWCIMAQELILNVLKTVFLVEVEEVSFSAEERKDKLGQGGNLSRQFDVKPQNDSERKDQSHISGTEDGKDVKDDYVLVDVCDADGAGGSQHGHVKDDFGGCKRNSGIAHLDGIGVVAPDSAGDLPLGGPVGNAKKFCEGITKSVDEFEEVIVINAPTDSPDCMVDGNHSSNACTAGKSSDNDCRMEVDNQHNTALEKQDAGSVSTNNRDQGFKGSSELLTPSTSSEFAETRSSKVFSYACNCRHQVWIDRKRIYAQVPQKHRFTALALEQEVTKMAMARHKGFLQKTSGADEGELGSLKTGNELEKSSPGQRNKGQVLKKSLVKDEELKEEKQGPQILPHKQNVESTGQAEKPPGKSKKARRQEVEFSCQIVYQNYDVDAKLPYILIKLMPTLSSSNMFRNFFTAFKSQIQRLITQHFSEMSS